jgi:hypothetical protein
MNGERFDGVEPAPALPADVAQHIDWLAARVHDAWVSQRMSAGWRYGPKRDDDRKEHPSLVSFGDLPERERQLDRASVTATLSGMLALGYRFQREQP